MNHQPTPLPLTISETVFQQTVIDTALMLSWHVVHFRPARVGNAWATAIQGMAGSPDLLMARNGRVLFVELKRVGGRPTVAQRSWLTHLGEYGRLWTPIEWNDGTIWQELNLSADVALGGTTSPSGPDAGSRGE